MMRYRPIFDHPINMNTYNSQIQKHLSPNKDTTLNDRMTATKDLVSDTRYDFSKETEILIESCEKGDLKKIKGLLSDLKIDPSVNYNRALNIACSKGYADIARFLLSDSRVDPLSIFWSTIYQVIKNGDTKIVDLIMSDPRVRASQHIPTSNVSSSSDMSFPSPDRERMSHPSGPSFDGPSKFGEGVLLPPISNKIPSPVNMKGPSYDDNKSIYIACLHGKEDIVKILLRHPEVDPSSCNNRALTAARKNGHLGIVKLLLQDSRVDPSIDENAVLYNSIRNGHLDIVKILIEDFRVDFASKRNYALRLALKGNCLEVRNLVLSRLVSRP